MTDRTKDPNTGHGHVYPRPDGVKARCGGPAICSTCAADAARKATFDAARERQESERSTPPPSNLVSQLRGWQNSTLDLAARKCMASSADEIERLREVLVTLSKQRPDDEIVALLRHIAGLPVETSDVRDAFNAGVTQAKYRRYYYEALLRVLNSDRMLSHDIARAAVDGSPEHSPVETAERRDYAAVRDAHDRTVEELERYKKALYTANGFLIQRGWEPVKLEYSEGNACPDCQGHGWRRRAFTADDAGECPTCAGSGRLGGPSPLKASATVVNAAGTAAHETPQFIETNEDGSPLKASAPLCEQHGQIVETGCPACEAALGRITSDPWVCQKCQQLNSAGATTCGRCEDL